MAKTYVLSEADYVLLKDMANQFRRRLQGKGNDGEQDRPAPASDVYLLKLEEGDTIDARSGTTPGVKEDCPIYKLTEDLSADPVTATLEAIQIGDDPFSKRVYNPHEKSINSCAYYIVVKQKGGGWTVEPPDNMAYVLTACRPGGLNVYILSDLGNAVGRVVRYLGKCYTVQCAQGFDLSGVFPVYAQVELVTDCDSCKSCYELRPCVGTTAYRYTNTDLSAYVGKVVRPVDTGICATVYVATNCLTATPLGNYDYYETCSPCTYCYTLTPCWGGGSAIKVTNDLRRLVMADTEQAVVDAGYTFEVNGQCYQATAYGNSCSGVTSPTITKYFGSCSSCGCYKLTPCTGTGAPIYAREGDISGNPVSLGDLIDGDSTADPPIAPTPYVRLSDGLCYSMSRSSDCTSTSVVTIKETYESCELCLVYTLTACTGTATKTTFTDLAGLGYSDNDVIKLSDATCWTITNHTAAYAGSVEVTPDPTNTDPHPSCGTCQGTVQYKLHSDCTHPNCTESGADTPDDIYTNTDLHDKVGKYVKYQGICYKVSIQTGTAHTSVALQSPDEITAYETCDECTSAVTTWTQRQVINVTWDGTNLKQTKQEVKVTGESACLKTETIDTSDACA